MKRIKDSRVTSIENWIVIISSCIGFLFAILVGITEYKEYGQLWKSSPIELFTILTYPLLFLYLRKRLQSGYIGFICSLKEVIWLVIFCLAIGVIMTSLSLSFSSQFKDSIESLVINGNSKIQSILFRFTVTLGEDQNALIHLLLHLQFLIKLLFFYSTYFLVRKMFLNPSILEKGRTWLTIHSKDIITIYLVSLVIFLAIILPSYLQMDLRVFSYQAFRGPLLLAFFLGTIVSVYTLWLYPYRFMRFSEKIVVSIAILLFFSYGISMFLSLSSPVLNRQYGFQKLVDLFSYSISGFTIGHVFSGIHFQIRKKKISSNKLLSLQLQRRDSELSLLKSQINPHFLFNSLNTVYGLALEEESPKAAEGVQKLSEMMRFMLQENTADKIPLEREIKYIHDYIDFQGLRISDKENINLDIEIAEGCDGQIAPMLLIPMIENAFKHGISMQEPSWIKVALTCGQNEVSLNVQNSMHPKTNRKSEESGIGLENVRKRLDILFPQKHTFQLFENDDSFEANVKVTLS